MIIKMKELTFFVHEKGLEQALKALRRMGAVHIKSSKTQPHVDINALDAKTEEAKQAVYILKQYAGKARRVNGAVLGAEGIEQKVKAVLDAYNKLQSYRIDEEKINQSISWFKPWGRFNPGDIKALAKSGVYISLYKLSRLQYEQIKGKHCIEVLSSGKQWVHIACVYYDKKESLAVSAKEETLPLKSYDDLYAARHDIVKNIKQAELDIASECYLISRIEGYAADISKKRIFLNALNSMKKETAFAYIQGYLPYDKTKELARLAKSEGAGYCLDDPKDIDSVPTLIRNPKWIDIISPVFKFMNTVPGYGEYDISMWFLLFFSLFFAMLIGDAGYGMIFLVGTYFANRHLKHLPKQPFFLLYVLSSATILWGAVTGTWFGSEKLAQLPFLSPLIIQGISSFAADNQNLMIFICFTIGIVHLTIAHLAVAARFLNSLKVLAEIGWILVLWALYFIAGFLVIGRPMPGYTLYLLYSGTCLLLIFSQPQKNILKSICASLTNIPLKIISSFADIVSYLRLFAVGYATVVLAGTFNNMAVSIGFNSVISSIAVAVILLLGHLLNIVLGFMAVIVHGIRLNMLEFSGHMDMSWSGTEYEPFKE